MIKSSKTNLLAAWLVFAISFTAYLFTLEPTASFWDSGEFIAVSYKLGVPHAPGAPLFLLIGRLFSFLAGGNLGHVAYWINMISVLSSSFTVFFLFSSIILLGKKLIKITEEVNAQSILLTLGAVTGSLAYAFSDSFWFSAVETEVYALSSLFTAFVIWVILKWELIEEESTANKWLILLAYMMGLSIGVHLLNLLAIPSVAIIYYSKKYPRSLKGFTLTILISFAAILALMYGIIFATDLAETVEIFLVNNIGLPFNSGIILFFTLLIAGLVYGIRSSILKQKAMLNTMLLAVAFIIIGYSSYLAIIIRSNYDPTIDENNPESINSFSAYVNMDQYPTRPLLYGPYFTAKLIDQEKGAPIYKRGKDKYEIVNYKIENIFDKENNTFLPRAYSSSHADTYRQKMNLKPGEKPDFKDNISYMFSNQVGYMYMRYFLWNFSGRESGKDGAGWLSPLDKLKNVPPVIANNKARNNYLMLPLILGLIGFFFQYKKDRNRFYSIFILFLITGIGLVVYINAPPTEPRERDYIYVASFYAFAIWIGLGAISLSNYFLANLGKKQVLAIASAICFLAIPLILITQNWDDHDRSNRYYSVDSAKNLLNSCAPNAILFTGGDNDTFPLWYVQEVEGFRTDVRVIVGSYFNSEWYIDQMTRPSYKSEPLPFSLTKENYKEGGLNDFIYNVNNPNVKGAINVSEYLKLVKNNHPAIQAAASSSQNINTIPSKMMYLNVDVKDVLKKGIIPENKKELLTEKMVWQLKGNGLYKKDLMILDLIDTNKWERPIYFNAGSLNDLNVNLEKYVIQEGDSFRLLPIENPQTSQQLVNTSVMYENMMKHFYFREVNNPEVNHNEYYQMMLSSERSNFNILSQALIQEGKNDKAREVLATSLKMIPDKSIPYDFTTIDTVGLLFYLEEPKKAVEIANTMSTRGKELLDYLAKNKSSVYNRDVAMYIMAFNKFSVYFKNVGLSKESKEFERDFKKYYSIFYS